MVFLFALCCRRHISFCSLSFVVTTLQAIYGKLFGDENFVVISNSNRVNEADLQEGTAYVQITSVAPYFEEHEQKRRKSYYERFTNLRTLCVCFLLPLFSCGCYVGTHRCVCACLWIQNLPCVLAVQSALCLRPLQCLGRQHAVGRSQRSVQAQDHPYGALPFPSIKNRLRVDVPELEVRFALLLLLLLLLLPLFVTV